MNGVSDKLLHVSGAVTAALERAARRSDPQ
jgi:hypothetical protein